MVRYLYFERNRRFLAKYLNRGLPLVILDFCVFVGYNDSVPVDEIRLQVVCCGLLDQCNLYPPVLINNYPIQMPVRIAGTTADDPK